MITYKYKLYLSKHNNGIVQLMREACFVWNHCLAMQKRYYSLYHKYIHQNRLKSYFAKHYKMEHLDSQTVQEVIERLDLAYQRFFDRLAKRPPKFKRRDEMASIVFKQSGYKLNDNRFTVNKLKRTFKFSLSRPYDGNVKRVSIKKSPLGELYICIVTDASTRRYGKTHDGASVGMDFGLKTYLTLSDGTKVENPQFLKRNLNVVQKANRRLSKAQNGSNNRQRRKMELDRAHEKVTNSRRDIQWKLAHEICQNYDNIFIENLNIIGMCRHKHWGRKMHDLAHGEFVEILKKVADKYGCAVHEIDRWYPSSRMCECGYKNDSLKLSDRTWVCPQCGQVHDRDLNAARNILRKGVSEMESISKTKDRVAIGSCVRILESHRL